MFSKSTVVPFGTRLSYAKNLCDNVEIYAFASRLGRQLGELSGSKPEISMTISKTDSSMTITPCVSDDFESHRLPCSTPQRNHF